MEASGANLYLRKGWSSGSQSTVCSFLKLKLSGSRQVAWQLTPRRLRQDDLTARVGLNAMVTCQRLKQCSDRKKRHVRHVHSRLHLARRFATFKACFPKKCFIDEKVRFNGVRQQGSCVQIISGTHKPKARHKWNRLKLVTNALLDVALTTSSIL